MAFITVDAQGENRIVVVQGANKAVDIPYIDANMDLLAASDIVLLQLEIPLETVVYAAEKAKALGKTLILDPAPARTDIPESLYQNLDLFLRDSQGHTVSFPADHRVQAVDTTAAGDSFTAAMAYGLSNGWQLTDAVKLAVRVSNIVVTRKGAQASIPNMWEVEGESSL